MDLNDCNVDNQTKTFCTLNSCARELKVTTKLIVLKYSLQLVILSAVFVVFLAVQFCSPEFGFKRLIITRKCHGLCRDPQRRRGRLSSTWVHL